MTETVDIEDVLLSEEEHKEKMRQKTIEQISGWQKEWVVFLTECNDMQIVNLIHSAAILVRDFAESKYDYLRRLKEMK